MYSTPLTCEKLRFFQLDQAHPGSALMNLLLALALTGVLDVDALSWAVAELGRRNPILRSAVMMCDGRAYQVTKSLELELEVEDYRGSTRSSATAPSASAGHSRSDARSITRRPR